MSNAIRVASATLRARPSACTTCNTAALFSCESAIAAWDRASTAALPDLNLPIRAPHHPTR
ncbi:hypothetical protein Acsp02_13930 [Actinoplanes sp. NBRC 103695]|nr:hypothetical protein Acsp02_13930 [Actinoplanes sp. NBRC 103695]